MEEEEVTGNGDQLSGAQLEGRLESWPNDDEGMEEAPVRASQQAGPFGTTGGGKRRSSSGPTGAPPKKLRLSTAATRRQEAAARANMPKKPKARPVVSG